MSASCSFWFSAVLPVAVVACTAEVILAAAETALDNSSGKTVVVVGEGGTDAFGSAKRTWWCIWHHVRFVSHSAVRDGACRTTINLRAIFYIKKYAPNHSVDGV
jgi:hypothetical protein